MATVRDLTDALEPRRRLLKCVPVTELTDIAGVHRQNTSSTIEMVQPVLYNT
jgi:hypothetical protein